MSSSSISRSPERVSVGECDCRVPLCIMVVFIKLNPFFDSITHANTVEAGVEKGSTWWFFLTGQEPLPVRQILEMFPKQHWGNFWESGQSAYGLSQVRSYHLEVNRTVLCISGVCVCVCQATTLSLMRALSFKSTCRSWLWFASPCWMTTTLETSSLDSTHCHLNACRQVRKISGQLMLSSAFWVHADKSVLTS